MFKKRWFDGLQDIYEGKDEFEIKFGCFGGDGGNGGSSNTGKAQGEHDTTPSTGFRGEQSAASPSNKGYSGPSGAGIGPDATTSTSGQSSMDSFSGDNVSQANQNIADAIQASIAANQAVNNPMNMSINDMFSPTVTNPTQATQAALTTAPAQANTIATGFQSAQNAITSDLVANQREQATNPYGNTGMDPSLATPSSTPGMGFNAYGFNISPTNISPTSVGFIATKPLAKGGVVHQGIGSVFPYRRR